MSSETVSSRKKLSSSLKERLKRCGRYHSSPIAAPPRKLIKYPTGASPQAFSITELDGKGDNQQKCISIPAESTVGCVNAEEKMVTYSTPLKSNDSRHLKDDFLTPISRKSNTFMSPTTMSSTGDDSLETSKDLLPSALHTPLGSRSLSVMKTPGTKELPGKHPSIVSSFVSDSCCGESERYSGHLLTPNTAGPIEKNVEDNASQNTKYEQKYERTPIRSKNVAKPSRLNFPGMSNCDNLITNDVSQDVTNQRVIQSGSKCTSGDDVEILQEEYERLKNTLKEKEEELRKLNMVKMYRTKNDLDSLCVLVKKWRRTSQQALVDLHNKLPEPKPSLTQLINHLQIDHSLVCFNPEEETFLSQ